MKVSWTMPRSSAAAHEPPPMKASWAIGDEVKKKLNDSFSDQIDKPYNSNGDWSKEINDQINDECTNL